MKKAFTLLEFVFVVAIVGILAIYMMPSMHKNKLQEAAIQVASHIRYTQHLAMVGDKYDVDDSEWFKTRWMIQFNQNITNTSGHCNNNTYLNIWSYTIFSDFKNTHTGNADKDEIAVNPNDPEMLLSGGYNNSLCADNSLNDSNQKSTKQMRLRSEYGIQDITFSGGCRSNVRYLYFDHLGRPFNSMNNNAPYELASSGWHKLLTSTCEITLCKTNCSSASSSEKITIYIEPETGYVHF